MANGAREVLRDVAPFEAYYRFVPGPDTPSGVVGTVWMGDVEAGRIYLISNPQTASILADHSEWQSAGKTQYEAQCTADARKEQS